MSAPHSGPDYTSGSPFRAPPPRKRPAWRTLVWILVAIAAALLLGFLLTPHDGGKGGKGGAGGPGGGRGGAGGGRGGQGGGGQTVVGVATVAKGDIPIELNELGTVTPLATVTVQPRIAGNIARIDFREGQMVKAGQLLVEIDNRPYLVALQQAQGQLLKDQAALADARLDLTRYTRLAATDSIAKQQVDTQAALVKQDEGVVASDQASVANAKLNIDYCRITSPVAGRVGLRQVDVGNYVSAGSVTTGLVVVTQLDPIDVEFTLPEDSIGQVAARVNSGATLQATALDRSGADTLAQGQLLTLDNQIDTTTGTVKAKARFTNASGALFPNQFVNIRLLVDTVQNVLVIPTDAVRHGSQGDFVYTVDLDQNAKVTLVKTGPVDGERTSIVSGLNEGDIVVTDGGDRLHDGSAVLLPADAQAMQKAPPPAKKNGFFAWLSGLFGGHKVADSSQAAAGGGAGAAASAGGGSASGGGGQGGGQAGGQGGGWSGHGGGGAGRGARLQAMLTPLGLTADQTAKVRGVLSDMREKAEAAGDNPDARRAAMKSGMDQLEAILTPDQKAKFEQERAQARAAGGWGGGQGGAPAGPGGPGGGQGAPGASASSGGGAPAPSGSAETGGQGGQAGGGPGGPGGGHGGGGGHMAAMLDNLGLTPEQKAKVDAILAAARQKAQGSDDPRSVMHDAFDQINAILTPEQKAKLEQARAQARAAGGWGGGGGQ